MTIQNGARAPRGSACLEKAELAFRDAMQATFGPLDWLPIPDGDIHRFRVPEDKPGTQNGWYVLYLDGIASGAFGSWKANGSQTWCSRKPADPLEAQLIAQRIERARKQRESEQLQRQHSAAERADRLWREASRADADHPYLIRKRAKPHSLRQSGDVLLVPLFADSRLVNIQRIESDGAKRFLFGGQVRGAYAALGCIDSGQPLYIVEGWATGATIHAETGAAVACAMNAGNLKPVAQALRAKYGDPQQIIIAGDDDRMTEGNAGRTAATAAALAIGAEVAFPVWPTDAPMELSDFNDLLCWRASHGI